MQGTVESFDEAAGLGWIVANGQRYLFHCTEITDGTRTIPVGRVVRFEPATRFGHTEAASVTPV